MAATAASDVTDGPVVSLINKRLRALRKKLNRIVQMEESIAQGKPINKEQEDVLRSKPAVSVLIEELEKLRQPLSSAVAEEVSLAIQRHQVSSDQTTPPEDDRDSHAQDPPKTEETAKLPAVEDLVKLLYFGSLFDVKSQADFTSIMLTRTHERGCCLTYDYVTDDATDLLGERDLDMISSLSGLLISRPVDSSLSHKNALQRCVEHAMRWLSNSDEPIEPKTDVSYAGLREKLNKIMASDYFTTTPEMKAHVEVAAAAAAGSFGAFQVPMHASIVPVEVPVQVEGSSGQYQQTDDSSFQDEADDSQPSPPEEHQQDELETHNRTDVVSDSQEQFKAEQEDEVEQNQREIESKEQQYIPRRSYQNQRGGRGSGGGRRGYSNGRGGRSGGRGGGAYQNGRNQYYEQPGNYYQRNYYNNRGRGSRGGGHPYNNHSSGGLGGRTSVDGGVAS
ncbi:uncharacterized protein LOC110822746 [Carica papaya]|uniref:uncharacterized protein LOC110822746 n=1 Tax=Carica papaya TaxID=3649 RepID=UPI000B8C76E6|nr:uncharacterized protein LOC110822746 [Carica papaya]